MRPILQAARGQFCCVVPINIKGVEDVGVLCQRILFSSLLKEDEHVFGVFDASAYLPGAARISLAGAGVKHFFQ